MTSLLFEAVFVGAFLALALGLTAALVDISSPMTAGLVGFLLGIGTHLFFEFTGLNARYCSIGHACTT